MLNETNSTIMNNVSNTVSKIDLSFLTSIALTIKSILLKIVTTITGFLPQVGKEIVIIILALAAGYGLSKVEVSPWITYSVLVLILLLIL